MNAHEINELVRLVDEILHVNYQISDIIETGRGKQSVYLNMPTSFYVRIWKELIQKYMDPERLSKLLIPTEYSKHLTTFFGKTICGVGECMCFITADGKVCLCPTLTHRENPAFLAGDIREESLKDIWERSDTFKKFRYINCKLLKLKKCKYAKICQGGCRSRAYLRFGGVEEPDYILCELMEACSDLFNQYKFGINNDNDGGI
jgi:radical SAM protein with 4Fe4S-binding SPASM domain